MTVEENNRILIVDDNRSIHEDFIKILAPQKENESFEALAMEIFQDSVPNLTKETPISYDLDHAYQGQQAYEMIEQAEQAGTPYGVVFMDVRMPPGWDGIETIKKVWARFPNIEMVVCTAYSDYSWEEILKQLGSTDQLMFLRKPFDVISVKQMALALTKKWNLGLKERLHVQHLEQTVTERTRELTEKVTELEKAMTEIRQLQGILPMCIYCHKIRDDENFWQRVDQYIQSHTIANVSHSVCPSCYDEVMAKVLDEISQEQEDETQG
ncbi:MAG: response regulator [Acidobacteria bacterium]|nr:response regulator [Acidobacteriota bacterium]